MHGLIGSLFALEKKGLLDGLTAYASSGNGCFISVLLCLGLSADKIRRLLTECKPSLFYDSQSYHYFTDIQEKPQGTDQFLELKFFFTRIFEEYVSLVPTFNQLYLITGKKLYLTSYNVSSGESFYFSRDTHPEMNLLKAIRLTTGVHHITCDVGYDGVLYIDASLANPLPVTCFRQKKILALRCLWNRSIDKLYPKTDHGYACLLLNIAAEKLISSSFRLCAGKSLFVSVSLGTDEQMETENLKFLSNPEQILLEGYDQTVSALKQINKSASNVVYKK